MMGEYLPYELLLSLFGDRVSFLLLYHPRTNELTHIVSQKKQQASVFSDIPSTVRGLSSDSSIRIAVFDRVPSGLTHAISLYLPGGQNYTKYLMGLKSFRSRSEYHQHGLPFVLRGRSNDNTNDEFPVPPRCLDRSPQVLHGLLRYRQPEARARGSRSPAPIKRLE